MTLPNFMIIGVAKAGTTSYFRYLDQHPQVFMIPIKGSNYFGYEDACDWQWTEEGAAPLLRHFQVTSFEAYEELFNDATDEIAIGEVSPQYFRCPTAAQKIHDHIPEVKLVASLRNPADRAFSGFMMRARRGEQVNDIHEELNPESSHVKEGFYFRRLKRYYDLFPKDHIKIYIFEKFKQDPSNTIINLFDFLNLSQDFLPDTSVKYNPAGVPRNRILNRVSFDPTFVRTAKSILPDSVQKLAKDVRRRTMKTPPKFPPDLRAELIDYYRADIHQLEELIDQDLSIWLN